MRKEHAKVALRTTPKNGRHRDERVLARASELMAEKPRMRAATALSRAGLTSPERIKRLSAALTKREDLAPPKSHSTNVKKRSVLPARAAGARRGLGKRLPNIAENEDAARPSAHAPSTATSHSVEAVAEEHSEIADIWQVGNTFPARLTDSQERIWFTMWHWSPVAILLRQTMTMVAFLSGVGGTECSPRAEDRRVGDR